MADLPVPEQLLIVLAAVLVLIVILRALARGREAGIADPLHLEAVVGRDHPDFVPARIIVGRDGQAAIALHPGQPLFLLFFRLGARRVAWRLPLHRLSADISRYDENANLLSIDTGDFTRPRVELALPDDFRGRGGDLPALLAGGAP